MCGIAGIVGGNPSLHAWQVRAMTSTLAHRGPDDAGIWVGQDIGLGNRRLAVLDLSSAGQQPMVSPDRRFVITFNGEIYNYLELRRALGGTFRTGTDTEVALRALQNWGPQALHRFNGMFALALWDTRERRLFLARDRFGVKPLYYATWQGALYFASEIKALAAAGVPMEPDLETWAVYLKHGIYDHSGRTFFQGIWRLPPGHCLHWQDGHGRPVMWYDLAARLGEVPLDRRSEDEVAAEYTQLMLDAVQLRFRADVPVGVCVSGGVDSSTLVGALYHLFGQEAAIQAYHFASGDPQYDETPWVRRLLRGSRYPLHVALLQAAEVPALMDHVAVYQEEPFGGFPTLAMVKLFQLARQTGTTVLLDGQGLDEQWGGYDYYARALVNERGPQDVGPVQGSRTRPTRPECLTEEFGRLAEAPCFPTGFRDTLQHWRYRDVRFTKIPRALRFSDRASSQASCELREPFLDYRLMELAFRQPPDRLLRHGTQKYLLRRIARSLLPHDLAAAPKRPVQTPQREWLRGPLAPWVAACLDHHAVRDSGWFVPDTLRQEWQTYLRGVSDNSFYIWQWLSVVYFDHTLHHLKSLAP